jgi:hypothetical protein
MQSELVIPTYAKIAYYVTFALMLAYLLATLWMVRDVSRGPVYVLGGIAKGIVLPALLGYAAHRSIFGRDRSTTAIVAIGWLSLSLLFGFYFASSLANAGAIASIPLLGISCIPLFLFASHAIWWRTLRCINCEPNTRQDGG